MAAAMTTKIKYKMYKCINVYKCSYSTFRSTICITYYIRTTRTHHVWLVMDDCKVYGMVKVMFLKQYGVYYST